MSTITFRLATDEDAYYVGDNLRECDRVEIQRGGTEDPAISPLKSLHASLIAWAMVREGRAIALFGVAPFKLAERTGVVWLLGTPECGRAAKTLVRSGRYYVGLMSRLFPILLNAVDVENITSRNWLSALGFKEIASCELNGNPFVVVEHRSPNV